MCAERTSALVILLQDFPAISKHTAKDEHLSCRCPKRTVWGPNGLSHSPLTRSASASNRAPTQSEGFQPKSMRELGLGVELDFNEFLQRQKHFLSVSFLRGWTWLTADLPALCQRVLSVLQQLSAVQFKSAADDAAKGEECAREDKRRHGAILYHVTWDLPVLQQPLYPMGESLSLMALYPDLAHATCKADHTTTRLCSYMVGVF